MPLRRGRPIPPADPTPMRTPLGLNGLRLSSALLARLDRYAAQLQRELPGMTVTRSSAARSLIVAGLDAKKVL